MSCGCRRITLIDLDIPMLLQIRSVSENGEEEVQSMIILAARLVKAFIPVLAMAGCVAIFRKKLSASQYIKVGMVILLFALVSFKVSDFVPPMNEKIIISATGEMNENATAPEVNLIGFSVDGVGVPVKKPLEGKWFWYGDTLCWRLESNPSQPEGMTRSITLEVPVGWERTANFSGAMWRGIVQIETAHGSQMVDTYSEEGAVICAQLGCSDTKLLILNQARYIAVYLAVIAVMLSICLLSIKRFIEDPDKLGRWMRRNDGKFVYGIIAVVMFAYMFRYADLSSLWYDEYLGISYTKGSLWEAIRYCLLIREYHPPLFEILANIWYHITPDGVDWLLLVCIVPCCISAFLTGLIGEEIKDKYTGAIAAALLAASTTVWIGQAYEYRPYAVFMMSFTLTLYCHVKRSKEPEKRKWHILYSLALLCLGMSDYYGMVACAEFFCADIYLAVKKKLPVKAGQDYIFPGIICFAWAVEIVVIASKQETLGSWMMPGYDHIINLYKVLSGNHRILFYLFMGGLALGLIKILWNKKNEFGWSEYYPAVISWMILFTTIGPIVIAKALGLSFTFWLNRYFLFLIPGVSILSANAVTFLIDSIFNDQNKKMLETIACIACVVVLFYNCLTTMSVTKASSMLGYYEPYRESADWIYTQINYIFNDDTIILSPEHDGINVPWQECYVTRFGERDPLNVKCAASVSDEELQNYQVVYFPYSHYDQDPYEVEHLKAMLERIEQYFTLEENNTAARVLVFKRTS